MMSWQLFQNIEKHDGKICRKKFNDNIVKLETLMFKLDDKMC